GGETKEERHEEREEHEHRASGGMLMNQSIDGGHPDHAKGGEAHEMHRTHGGHRAASGGAMLHNRGPHPGHGHPRHAEGGKLDDDEEGESGKERDGHVQEYNAQGSAAVRSATDEEPGFSEGGKTKKKKKLREGGHAEGEKAGHRLDRRPRRAAGGRTEGGKDPYSSASKMESPKDDLAGRGFESVTKDSRGTK
ncbi:MAG: hypothetical protein ABSG46_18615, partial [Candidatus Binataceae bacterium]